MENKTKVITARHSIRKEDSKKILEMILEDGVNFSTVRVIRPLFWNSGDVDNNSTITERDELRLTIENPCYFSILGIISGIISSHTPGKSVDRTSEPMELLQIKNDKMFSRIITEVSESNNINLYLFLVSEEESMEASISYQTKTGAGGMDSSFKIKNNTLIEFNVERFFEIQIKASFDSFLILVTI